MAQTTTPVEGVKAISRQELRTKSIDVSRSSSSKHCHLSISTTCTCREHAIAPPDRVEDLAPVLIPNQNTEVVTYCAGPKYTASADAARVLMSLGYTNVRHYAGGKQDWTTAGLPVERGHEYAARA